MQPYCDLDFLTALLVKCDAGDVANRTMLKFDPPFFCNGLIVVQLENTLWRAQSHFQPELSAEQRVEQVKRAKAGMRRWEVWRMEGVFEVVDPDWPKVYQTAAAWQRKFGTEVPHPRYLIHPAAARLGGATHFLSFEKAGRDVARQAGLAVLPDRL